MFVLLSIETLATLFSLTLMVDGQISLNTSFQVYQRKGCSDPLLPRLYSDPSKKYYGCCTVKPSSPEVAKRVCCLIAGSLCDPFGKNAPPPCKGSPCCAIDSDSEGAGTVRLTAGTIFEPNLRQRDLPSLIFSFDRNPMVTLKKDPKDSLYLECEDPKRKKLKSGIFHGLEFTGCCSSIPATPQESASKCCLISDSPCDGTIPCCSNSNCVLGKCSADVGFLTDRDLSGFCRYAVYGKSQPASTRRYRFDGAKTIKKCENAALPVGYNLTATGAIVCCKARVSITSAKIAQRNCCLQGGSPCDNTIDCCSGMPCCAGVCPNNSGNSFADEIINFYKPIC